MHSWSKNDAARIPVADEKGLVTYKVFRVLSVTRENCPTVRVKNEQLMAKHPDEWDHVGKYTWTWNPLTPGDPFYKFVPAE